MLLSQVMVCHDFPRLQDDPHEILRKYTHVFSFFRLITALSTCSTRASQFSALCLGLLTPQWLYTDISPLKSLPHCGHSRVFRNRHNGNKHRPIKSAITKTPKMMISQSREVSSEIPNVFKMTPTRTAPKKPKKRRLRSPGFLCM